MRVHDVGSTEWPAAISDGLTLPCQSCHRIPLVDYRVTDTEWARTIPSEWRLGVVCIDCFIGEGGDLLALVELQVTGHDLTVVLVPSVAYSYNGQAVP